MTSGLVTREDGGTATFSVVLNSKPTDNVTIEFSTADEGEGFPGTKNKAGLTFSPDSWANAQTVTVKGVDDDDCDGDANYALISSAASSVDFDYDGINPAEVLLTNKDNEQDCEPPPPNPPIPPPGPGPEGTSTRVNSFDPNDKLGSAGFGAFGFTSGLEALLYQIRFENKSDATAPAREIVVTEILDMDLDLKTFELTEITSPTKRFRFRLA